MNCNSTQLELETVYSRIKKKTLELQPDFQRGEVWKENKKKKLIDSILRGWKIPPIHIVRNADFIDEVLDGQQRLVSIRDFIDDEFTIDGYIAPIEPEITQLDGLTFSQLNEFWKRKINAYSINIITLTEYKPEEPAELFYRLNQPTSLTSAEQRNAFIGKPRDQVKELSKNFEAMGADKESIGFSNSRMSYDETISKLCYAIENHNISRKITSAQMSEQYREGAPFSEKTIKIVTEILEKLIKSIKLIPDYKIKFSKASIFSWMLFIKANDLINETKLAEMISLFEFSRSYVKGLGKDGKFYPYIMKFNLLKSEYPFFEVLLNIYNQRASLGSTDGLAIVERDVILYIFSKILFGENDEKLQEFISIATKQDNLSKTLSEFENKYNWGEVF
jgi:hypothetical protein